MTTPPAPAARQGSRLDPRLIGIGLVIASACAFGSGALFAKPVYASGVDWLTLLYWRFLIAAALSWAWLVALPGNRASLKVLTRRRCLVLIALGLFYVGNSGTYFAALETVPASLAALIVYAYPALVAVLSLRFGRRLRGRRAWLALGTSTVGVGMAVGGIPSVGGPPLVGLGLAIASPVIYAAWIVMAARLGGERRDASTTPTDTLERGLAGTPSTGPRGPAGDATPRSDAAGSAPTAAVMTTATGAVYLMAMVMSGHAISPTSVPSGAWVGLVGVGVVSTAVALQAFYAGARRIGAARASLISTVEPIYTITLASVLFHESLAPIQLLGGGLIIGAVLLAESGQADPSGNAGWRTLREADAGGSGPIWERPGT